MHEEWKPIYTALVCDIMDQLGHRDQAMSYDIRPSHADAWIAGTAVTLDAYENHQEHDDPYGQIFAAYEVAQRGDVAARFPASIDATGLPRYDVTEPEKLGPPANPTASCC